MIHLINWKLVYRACQLFDNSKTQSFCFLIFILMPILFNLSYSQQNLQINISFPYFPFYFFPLFSFLFSWFCAYCYLELIPNFCSLLKSLKIVHFSHNFLWKQYLLFCYFVIWAIWYSILSKFQQYITKLRSKKSFFFLN